MKISKVIAGLLIAGVSMAFANGMEKGCQSKMGQASGGQKSQSCNMKGKHNSQKGFDMMGKKGHMDGGFMKSFMASIDTLGLSSEQKGNIKKILDENKPKMSSPTEAFSETKFDTQKYIDIMQNKKSQMLKHQADVIEKVYAVLTSEQKVALKKELENQNNNQFDMMKGNHDTGSSCRR